MTRIIAGFAGSRELVVPKSGTRPTTDRVREALFSALDAQDLIRGARVVDLFAGSGSLGLEALSRGAATITLVEKNSRACAMAQRNAAMVIEAGNLSSEVVRVACSSVESYLASSADLADLIFLDPPFEMSDDEVDAVMLGLSRLVSDNGVVVTERSSRSRVPASPPGLTLVKSRAYGETTLHWFRALR